MSSILDWWLQYNAFSSEQLDIINQFCPHTIKKTGSDLQWEKAVQELKTFVPFGQSLPNNLILSEFATTLIDNLFDQYINDDTLLITSVVEHESVVNNVKRFNRENNNHVKMHYYNGINSLNLLQVKQALRDKKYKKVFVYIIGTQITTGEITPNKFFIELKEYLISQGLEVIMVLDDVHGMFLVPRDYSIFDYIIFTAHALIRRWDMGMLWSKKPIDMDGKYINWLTTYIQLLQLFMTRKDKLQMFSLVMQEEFIDYLTDFEYMSDSVPHIFSIKVDCPPKLAYTESKQKEFADNEVRLECGDINNDKSFFIRMRGSQYITFPQLLPTAVNMTKDLLDRVKMIKEIQ